MRSGIRTPLILYSYGTGLRGIRGRLGDASAILAQVGTEDPYRLLALYSLGQIAAERGEAGTALDLFRRVEEGAGGVEPGGFLAARAARSRAELLLSAGKPLDAAPVFEALSAQGREPAGPDRSGRRRGGSCGLPRAPAAGDDRQAAARGPGPVPPPSRRGREEKRARRDGGRPTDPGREGIGGSAFPAAPPSSEATARSEVVESLRLQLGGLRKNPARSLFPGDAAGRGGARRGGGTPGRHALRGPDGLPGSGGYAVLRGSPVPHRRGDLGDRPEDRGGVPGRNRGRPPGGADGRHARYPPEPRPPDRAIPPPHAHGKEPGGDPSSPGADPGAPGSGCRHGRGREGQGRSPAPEGRGAIPQGTGRDPVHRRRNAGVHEAVLRHPEEEGGAGAGGGGFTRPCDAGNDRVRRRSRDRAPSGRAIPGGKGAGHRLETKEAGICSPCARWSVASWRRP